MAGLRRVINEDEVKKVINVLTGDVSEMPKNWNRRFKYNREKIKTGDVFELAEVVRNLAIREWEKGLSTGEKQMYTRAKKILASEFMYALDKDEEGAEDVPGRAAGGALRRQGHGLSLRSGRRVTPETEATAVIAAAGSGEQARSRRPEGAGRGRRAAARRVVARGRSRRPSDRRPRWSRRRPDQIERFERGARRRRRAPVEVVAGGGARSESVAGGAGRGR